MSFIKYIHYHNQNKVLFPPKHPPETLCHQPLFPAAATTSLLSVAVVLPFLESQRKEIIQYAVFCVWPPSLSTMP